MPGKFENAYNENACVANALNLLYRLYKWFRRVRGPAATQANNENETKVFSPLMKMDKMFCAHWLQRSEATKTLKCTFENAHIEALSPPWSRLPAEFSSPQLTPAIFERCDVDVYAREVLIFLIYLPCPAVKRTLQKKKAKPNTFHGLMTRWNCCLMSDLRPKNFEGHWERKYRKLLLIRWFLSHML